MYECDICNRDFVSNKKYLYHLEQCEKRSSNRSSSSISRSSSSISRLSNRSKIPRSIPLSLKHDSTRLNKKSRGYSSDNVILTGKHSESLSLQLKQAVTIINRLRGERDNLKNATVKTRNYNNSDMIKKEGYYESQRYKFESRIADLQIDVTERNVEIDNLNNSHNSLRNIIKSSKVKLQSLKDKSDAENVKLQSLKDKSDAENVKLQKEIWCLQNSNNDNERMTQELTTRLEDCVIREKKNKKYTDEYRSQRDLYYENNIKHLHENNKKLRIASIKIYEEKINNLNQQVENTKNTENISREELTVTQSQLYKFKQDNEIKQQSLNNNHTKHIEFERVICCLYDDISKLNIKSQSLEAVTSNTNVKHIKEIKNMESKIKEGLQRIEYLISDNNELRIKINEDSKSMQDMKTLISKLVSDKNKEVLNLTEKLNGLEITVSKLRMNFTQSMNKLTFDNKSQIEIMETHRESLKTRIKQYKIDITILEKSINKKNFYIKSSQDKIDKQYNDMTEELHKKQREINALKEKFE
jgi:hypothetical protein